MGFPGVSAGHPLDLFSERPWDATVPAPAAAGGDCAPGFPDLGSDISSTVFVSSRDSAGDGE